MENNNDNINDAESKKDENKKKQKKIIIILLVFVLVFVAVFGALEIINRQNTTPDEEALTTTEQTQQAGTVENPIDFASLQEQNDEIYAWIKVDGTKVDYPIVQNKNDDSFYLRHKAEDKSWSASGAIYTEFANTKTFNDSVTVIYGHNGYSDSMFTTLHYFEKKEFFDSHPYFYIYTPTSRLTYQIISAFKYDDRHIMNSFDFSNASDLAEFQETVCNPTSSQKNVRETLETEINEGSKIAVLSTCITNQKSSRYLVCGVLVKDEKTY